MKVILQQNVDNLGYVGDILDVAKGYARNYLLPRGMAQEANDRNVKALEHIKRVTAQKAQKEKHGLEAFADKLSKISLTFSVKTGKEDKLFGSVTSKDIEQRLAEQGFDVDRKHIQLEHSIKELGSVTVPIRLHRDVFAKITVNVVKMAEDTDEVTEGAAKQKSQDDAESGVSSGESMAPSTADSSDSIEV